MLFNGNYSQWLHSYSDEKQSTFGAVIQIPNWHCINLKVPIKLKFTNIFSMFVLEEEEVVSLEAIHPEATVHFRQH